MKFIGKYIQDFVAIFKNEVYLDDISTGTIASGGNLGLDSNNKIVKANEVTVHDAVTLAGTPDYITLSGQEITRNAIDLAADVTGTLPVANGGTGAALHSTNSVLTGNGTSAIQSESELTFSGTTLQLGSVSDHTAQIQIINDNNALALGVSNATNGGIIGTVDGDVFLHSSGNHNICIGQSSTTDLKIDTSGDVVVSNNLDVTGTITGDVTGTLTGQADTVASIGNLTGDVTSSNRATTIADDAVTYAKMQNVTATDRILGRDSAGAGVVEEITPANLRTMINVEDGATADQTQADINSLAITTTGALDSGSITSGFGAINNGSSNITTTGTIRGGRLDIDYGSVPTATIDGSRITLIGDTNDLCIIDCSTHGATTITTIDTAAAAANLGFNIDGAITATSSSFTATTDTFTVTSGTTFKPDLILENTAADNKPIFFKFYKNRTGTDNDYLGSLHYSGNDDAGNTHSYSFMDGQIIDASNGTETGRQYIAVSANGTPVEAFDLVGSNSANIVNAFIGYGATSLTTVAGDLKVTGNEIKDDDGTTCLTFNSAGGTSVNGNFYIENGIFLDGNQSITSSGGSGSLSINPSSILNLGNNATDSINIGRQSSTIPVSIYTGTATASAVFQSSAITFNHAVTTTADVTVGGNLKAPTRQFDLPADGAGNASGDVVFIGTNDPSGGNGLTAGKIYYYKSDGAWNEAQANNVNKSGPVLLGVALGTTPSTHGVLLRGTVVLSVNITGTEALGSVLYLDDVNAAAATVTQPATSGDIVRVIGYALTTGDTNKIWFNPDNTFIEV